jgi:hypothetical protein
MCCKCLWACRIGLKLCIKSTRKRKAITRHPHHFKHDELDDHLLTSRQIGQDYIERVRRQASSYQSVPLSKFKATSRRRYDLVESLAIGHPVFTDRALKWVHLPDILLGAMFISTPCDDYAVKARDLISFNVLRPSLVFVMIDAASLVNKQPPQWLARGNYVRVHEPAVARQVRTWTINSYTSIDICMFTVCVCIRTCHFSA